MKLYKIKLYCEEQPKNFIIITMKSYVSNIKDYIQSKKPTEKMKRKLNIKY